MSKIFEALTKLNGGNAPVPGLDTSGNANAQEVRPPETPSVMNEASEVAGESVVAAAAALPVEPEEALHAEPAYRVLPLRLTENQPLFPFDGSDSRSAEQYRMIRTNLDRNPLRPQVIAVSSTSSGDGKTVTSINVAGILALKNQDHVLLLDADMRRPSVADLLGIPNEPGLAGFLANQCSLDEAIVQLEELPNLCVLPAGVAGVNPSELLDSDAWRELIAELRNRFQLIIVDTTPIDAVADYSLVEVVADGIVIVIRPDHTRRWSCDAGLSMVPQNKFLGVILNDVEDWFLWRRSAGYAEYSYYANSPAATGGASRSPASGASA